MVRRPMAHLIDDRQPITTREIMQAVVDADEWLDRAAPIDTRNLIERLQAIVCDAYGYEPRGADDDA